MIDKFKPSGEFRLFYQQVAFFRERFALDTVLLFQVGAYLETYAAAAAAVLAVRLNLHKRYGFRGMALTCGRPVGRTRNLIDQILGIGLSVAVVVESDKPGRYIKERYLKEFYKVVDNEG